MVRSADITASDPADKAALTAALEHMPAAPPPPLRKNIGWKLKMHGRTILELVGLRKKEDPASIFPGAP